MDVDECNAGTNPCGSSSICTNIEGDFVCECMDGFASKSSGGECEDVNECATDANPCNDGICNNTEGSFSCNCNGTGFGGIHCDEDVDECAGAANPCNGGKCRNSEGTFTCDCEGTGFEGIACNVDVNECELMPSEIVNGSTSTASSTASSDPVTLGGVRRARADHDGSGLGELSSMLVPCSPNSICTNFIGTYECACRDGYAGDGFDCAKTTATSTPTTTATFTVVEGFDVCNCNWPEDATSCINACATPSEEAEADCILFGYNSCNELCFADMGSICTSNGGADGSTDASTNVIASTAATSTWLPMIIVAVILGVILVVYLWWKAKNKKFKRTHKILPALPEDEEAGMAAPTIAWEGGEQQPVETVMPEVSHSVASAGELKEFENKIKDEFLSTLARQTKEGLAEFSNDPDTDKDQLNTLIASEHDLNEAAATFFAAKLFDGVDFGDFEPSLDGIVKLGSNFATQLVDFSGDDKLGEALEMQLNGDPNAAEALKLALGQSLASIEREARKYQLNLAQERDAKAANLQADLQNRLARRLKAVKAQHAVVLAETAIVAPHALPPHDDDAMDEVINSEEAQAAKLDLEGAFKRAYLDGLRNQLMIDREKAARAASTDDALRNRLAAKIKASEKLLEDQLASNKAAAFAERFVEAQVALNGFVGGISGLEGGTEPKGDRDPNFDADFRKIQIENRRHALAMDREKLQRRADLDSKLKSRLAAQLDAAEHQLDADDVDYAGQLRAAKMEQLRQQLQMQRDRLEAAQHLDATLRNRLAAKLKAAETKLNKDDEHFTDGYLVGVEIDALQKQIFHSQTALDAAEDEAEKAQLTENVAELREKLQVEKLDHAKYLKRARAEALRHQLSQDRAMLDRCKNMNSALKNRLAGKIKAACNTVDMIEKQDEASNRMTADLHQQFSDRAVDLAEASKSVGTAYTAVLTSMIDEAKQELEHATTAEELEQLAIRRQHIILLRKKLQEDRNQLEQAANTDMALKQRLLRQIKANEVKLEEVSPVVGLDDATTQIVGQLEELEGLLRHRNSFDAELKIGLQLEREAADMLDAERDVFEQYRRELAAALASKQAAPLDEPGRDKQIEDLEQLIAEADQQVAMRNASGSKQEGPSLPLEMALKAAFDEGTKQRAAFDENAMETKLKKARLAALRKKLADDRARFDRAKATELRLKQRLLAQIEQSEAEEQGLVDAGHDSTVEDQMEMQQKVVAEAKTDLAFVSPTAAIRVAHESAAQLKSNRRLSVDARKAGTQQESAASGLSEEDAEAFKQQIKASYMEGLKTEGDDASELESRLRKSRLTLLRKKLQDDRHQLERAASTDMALKQRLLTQIEANEATEKEEATIVQLQEIKMQIASDKADAFAAQFLEVFDAPSAAVVVDISSGDQLSPSGVRRGSRRSSSSRESSEEAAEKASKAQAKMLEHAMDSAMKAAFQQGTRQTLAWNREESHQRQSNKSKVQDRLTARMIAAEKSKEKIAKREKERKANAQQAEEKVQAREKVRKLSSHSHNGTIPPPIDKRPSLLGELPPLAGQSSRFATRKSASRPQKTPSFYERDFLASDKMFQAREKQEKREHALMIKKRKEKAKEKRSRSPQKSANQTVRDDFVNIKEATEIRAMAMAEEVAIDRQRAKDHMQERIAKAKEKKTAMQTFEPASLWDADQQELRQQRRSQRLSKVGLPPMLGTSKRPSLLGDLPPLTSQQSSRASLAGTANLFGGSSA